MIAQGEMITGRGANGQSLNSTKHLYRCTNRAENPPLQQSIGFAGLEPTTGFSPQMGRAQCLGRSRQCCTPGEIGQFWLHGYHFCVSWMWCHTLGTSASELLLCCDFFFCKRVYLLGFDSGETLLFISKKCFKVSVD